MKTQLTADDPAGYYLCQFTSTGLTSVREWDGETLLTLEGVEAGCQYTNFRRLYTEDEVLELKAELSRLKSQPYPMRRADKPDCVGLWKRLGTPVVNEITTLEGYFSTGPWYYLGPIPVVREQLPPKVVRVRNQQGEELRAIPTPCGSSLCLLNEDGTFHGQDMANNWEEVQS